MSVDARGHGGSSPARKGRGEARSGGGGKDRDGTGVHGMHVDTRMDTDDSTLSQAATPAKSAQSHLGAGGQDGAEESGDEGEGAEGDGGGGGGGGEQGGQNKRKKQHQDGGPTEEQVLKSHEHRQKGGVMIWTEAKMVAVRRVVSDETLRATSKLGARGFLWPLVIQLNKEKCFAGNAAVTADALQKRLAAMQLQLVQDESCKVRVLKFFLAGAAGATSKDNAFSRALDRF